MAIVDSILSLDLESDQIRQSNLDFRFDFTMMIRFATFNRISSMQCGSLKKSTSKFSSLTLRMVP